MCCIAQTSSPSLGACTEENTHLHLSKTLKSTWISALQIALPVVTAAIWQGMKAQHPDSRELKKPFPERNLLPRSGLNRCQVSDQPGLPRRALLGDTGSMWVTRHAGSHRRSGLGPSVCQSLDSSWTASTECTEGTHTGFKKILPQK